MPNPFPIHGVSLGAAAASQLMQSVHVPALTLQLPTPANLAKLSVADRKTVAIAAGIGGVAAYALGRRAWVAVLGALGGAVYGLYRSGAAAPVATIAPATTAQFVDAAILSKSPAAAPPLPALPPGPTVQSPVTAAAPAPPPGAASAPAAEPPPAPPADPAAVPVVAGV